MRWRRGVRGQRLLQHAPEPQQRSLHTASGAAAAAAVRTTSAGAGSAVRSDCGCRGRGPATTTGDADVRRRSVYARYQTGGVLRRTVLRRPRRHVAVQRRRVCVPRHVDRRPTAATRPTATSPPHPSPAATATAAASPAPPNAAAAATTLWPAKQRWPAKTRSRRRRSLVGRPDGRAHLQVDASQTKCS